MKQAFVLRNHLILGIGIMMLVLSACGGEVQDSVSDFLSGCHAGDLNSDYPQSAEIDCLINLPNGIDVNDVGQSTASVHFTPDGSRLYTLSSGLQAWNVETWEEVDLCESESEENCHPGYFDLAYFNETSEIVGVSRNGQIYGGPLGDSPKFEAIFESIFADDPENPSRTPEIIYIAGYNTYAKYNHNLIRFFSAETGELLSEQEEPFGIQTMAGGRDYYATALKDNQILVLPINTSLSGALLQGHTAAISEMLFSDDNTRLVSVDQSGSLIVWDLGNGSQLMQTTISDLGNVMELGSFVADIGVEMALSTDNQLLVIRREGPTLTFINTETGEILAETELSRPIRDLAISPDRTKLAIGYASKKGSTSRREDPNDRLSPEITEEFVSRGPAVILEISQVGP